MSIVIITVGCFIATAGDLEFDTVAYLAGLTSVFAQGGYLTLVQMASAAEASLINKESQVLPKKIDSILLILIILSQYYLTLEVTKLKPISGIRL